MIAILQAASGVLANRLEMGRSVGSEAHVGIGRRHSERLEAADFVGVAQEGA